MPQARLNALSVAITELAEAATPTFHDPIQRAEFVKRVMQHCSAYLSDQSSISNGSRDTLHSTDRSMLNVSATRSVSPNADSINAQSLSDTLRVQVSQDLTKLVNQDGEKMINDYAMLATIGRGSVGKVKLAVNTTTDKVRAIKILNKSLLMRVMKGDGVTALTQVQQEVAIMKKLNHKNIVRMHEVIDDPQENKMYIVMDYVPDGPIFAFDRETGTCPVMPVNDIRRVMRQLCAGLLYLHRHGIVHRDIKPDNILIDKSTQSVYLCDFGVSEICGDGTKGLSIAPRMEGTPMYMAPEVFNVSESAASALDGERLDVWAWGVTLYCMMYGLHPFKAQSVAEARQLITAGGPTIDRAPPTPDAAANQTLWNGLVALLSRMLECDPAQRATVEGVRAALRALGPVDRSDILADDALKQNDVIEANVADVQCSIGLASHAVVPSGRRRLSVSNGDFTPPESPWLVPSRPHDPIPIASGRRSQDKVVSWERDTVDRSHRDEAPHNDQQRNVPSQNPLSEGGNTLFTPEPLRLDASQLTGATAAAVPPEERRRSSSGRHASGLSATNSDGGLPRGHSYSTKTTAEPVELSSVIRGYPYVSLLAAAYHNMSDHTPHPPL